MRKNYQTTIITDSPDQDTNVEVAKGWFHVLPVQVLSLYTDILFFVYTVVPLFCHSVSPCFPVSCFVIASMLLYCNVAVIFCAIFLN